MFYYKQGMVFSINQRDYDDCKIQSIQQIPQNMITKIDPGVYNPGTLSCQPVGFGTECKTVGDINIPPSSHTYDTNAGLRARFIDDCMFDKGYQSAVLPDCQDNEIGYNSLTQAPPIYEVRCFDPNSPTIEQ